MAPAFCKGREGCRGQVHPVGDTGIGLPLPLHGNGAFLVAFDAQAGNWFRKARRARGLFTVATRPGARGAAAGRGLIRKPQEFV
jgi:hypothetical protein